MSYSSTTIGIDNVVLRGADPIPFPIDTTGSNDVMAGDAVWMDTTNHWVASVDSDAHAAYFAGVAMDGSYIQPYSSKKYSPQIPVLTKGVVRFLMTSGDTYHDGDSVYIGATPQTITNTAGGSTHVIGYVKLPPNITSLAYAAGSYVQVQITPLWPVTSA